MKPLSRYLAKSLLGLARETREPTIASIPRILLRTVMRTLARVVLVLAGAALMVTVALLSVSLVLASFPSTHKQGG